MELVGENPSKQELSDLIAMLSEAFGYTPPDQISRDFPLLYSEKNIKHLWIAHSPGEKKIVSHAGSLFLSLHAEGKSCKVGGVGGVASLPEFRGQGLASKLVERCLKDLKAQGAALAFLWSDQHDFYRNLGFELVGRQWMVGLSRKQAQTLRESGEKFHCTKSSALVLREGKALYDQHSLRIERSATDFAALLGSRGVKVFSAERDGKLAGYLVIGKGIDLKDHVHEWAGSVEALLALLAFALEEEECDLTLLSPQFTEAEAPILYRLEQLGSAAVPGFMALVKILDFGQVKELVLAKMRSLSIDPTFLRFEHTGEDEYCIGWTTDPDLYMNGREFARFIFGPDPPSRLVPELPENSRAAYDGLFPYRLWWWGMDSV